MIEIVCITGPGNTSLRASGWQGSKCNHVSKYFTWKHCSRCWGQRCVLPPMPRLGYNNTGNGKGCQHHLEFSKGFVSVNCSVVYLIPNRFACWFVSFWSTVSVFSSLLLVPVTNYTLICKTSSNASISINISWLRQGKGRRCHNVALVMHLTCCSMCSAMRPLAAKVNVKTSLLVKPPNLGQRELRQQEKCSRQVCLAAFNMVQQRRRWSL
jgi:hypothetical protein